MKFSRISAAGVLCSLVIAAAASGQEGAKYVSAAKAATALVVLPGESGFATAFCVDSAGYFITNYHVVKDLEAGAHLTLVLNAGQDDEKSVSATSIRTDQEDDLAIVKAEGTASFAALPLSANDELVETQGVTVLGYPFGTALALEKSARPSVSVNLAHVSSLRKTKGKLQLIQLDSQLNPGNSGGPVIDDKGTVVGVVSSGVRAAGINFAVPASKMAALLDRPELSFTPPVILDDKIHEPVALSIRAVPFGKPRPDLAIEVALSTPDGGERTFLAQSGSEKGLFTARVVPVPPRPANALPAVLTFSGGSIRCWVDDQTIRLDNQTFKLSSLDQLEFRATGTSVKSHDGSTVKGTTLSMTPLTARFGAYTLQVDATKAMSLIIGAIEKGTPSVSYRIVAKSKGAVIGELKGMLLGEGEVVASAEAPAAPSETPVHDSSPDPVPVGGGGPWVSLMNKIQPARDTDAGNWTLSGGEMRNVEQHEMESTRLTIPVMPTGSYVYQFTFIRSENGKDLCALFPVAGHGAMIWIGAFDGQQSSLDGPGTKGRGDVIRIMANKAYHVEITVLNRGVNSQIKMKLNGVDFLDWQGDPTRLQVNSGRATRDGRTFGLAVCHHTVVRFTDIRVRALSGSITPYVPEQ